MRSPGLRSSRVSRAGSAAAPKASPCARTDASSGSAGSVVDRAEQRIGVVDRFDLDQRRRPSLVRAIVGSVAMADTVPCAREKRARRQWPRAGPAKRRGRRRGSTLPARDKAVGQALATEPTPAIAMHAERDTGDEDAETAQAAAQFAPSIAQRQQGVTFWGWRKHHKALGKALGMTRASMKCVGA